MNDKDIINALEYCFTNDWNRTKCNKCKFYTGTTQCVEDLKSASIDLITRQKAEIERLQKEVNLVSIQFQDLQERYEEAQTEIERLKGYPYATQVEVSKKFESQIKSEAVKECLAKVKNYIKTHCNPYGKPDFEYDTSIKILNFIDNLVKEMVGDEK